MQRHIENLKGKPEHVRHKIALGASAGVTALVAVVWFAAHAATGSFALSTPQPTPEDQAAAENLAQAKTDFSQLAGAVGSAFGATSSDPQLTVVDDGDTRSSLDAAPVENQNQTGATSIPF
ncbi:MAG: hypothetical protein QOE22_242 [Candidatus Parcubacteria bacterium]|jgi:hypothetical protein|nr:hypothetical protein [Candidatus Parcubacteria bacterium]